MNEVSHPLRNIECNNLRPRALAQEILSMLGRNLNSEPQAIQIELSMQAVELFVSQWIRNIRDITDPAHKVHTLV